MPSPPLDPNHYRDLARFLAWVRSHDPDRCRDLVRLVVAVRSHDLVGVARRIDIAGQRIAAHPRPAAAYAGAR